MAWMKKGINITMALTTAILSSCADNDIGEVFVKDYGCVDLIYSKTGNQSISQTDLTSTQDLFSKNNISLKNLRFTNFDESDPLNTLTTNYIRITATQCINELPIFFSRIGFHLKLSSV